MWLFHGAKSARTSGALLLRALASCASPSEYCVSLVKKVDFENYLCLLLLKGDHRRAAFAVRALNAELSLVRDQVSRVEIGYGRLAFWRDAICKMYNGHRAPEHPVTKEIQWLLTSYTLTQQWFLRLIDSREANMKDNAFATLDAAEQYAELSCSPIYYLLLEAREIKRVDCDHTASHLGKAQGLANLIRSIPFNASKGRCQLPLNLLAKHSVTQEEAFRTPQTSLPEVVFEIASTAHIHLEKTEQGLTKLPKEIGDIFLPSVPLKEFLKKLQKANFNVFDPAVQARNSMLPIQLWKHKIQSGLGWF
ncbi:NADH dehydrogenase (ubiquinone) complex I, assembly factor 6-like isoform X2 [Varroa jacobsoni]|uniref:NADH dehydrogenase (ubiquinone) complex I, assembly factor 6-like isoform X2 n=1 Tax=Varroa jacobsoni TaxID=62625 RepID=UPI000BF83E23|nr:NADH dehydrogenase (ubiquinone) complex I, assembly factor 6-like isoform X2 [Varroa jacobsoni]